MSRLCGSAARFDGGGSSITRSSSRSAQSTRIIARPRSGMMNCGRLRHPSRVTHRREPREHRTEQVPQGARGSRAVVRRSARGIVGQRGHLGGWDRACICRAPCRSRALLPHKRRLVYAHGDALAARRLHARVRMGPRPLLHRPAETPRSCAFSNRSPAMPSPATCASTRCSSSTGAAATARACSCTR